MAYSLSLSCTTNSQDKVNNTSNITVKVKVSWTSGTWWGYSSKKYCIIDGTKYSFNDTKINPNATTSGSATLFSKTLNIKHNSNGKKTLEVEAYTETGTSSGNQSVSKDFTLTTIPRASTVSATNAVVGSESTITISRKASSFTDTIKYTFGSLSGTIASKTSSTSVKFTLPTSFYAEIGASATSKSGTITVETYSGSTKIGSNTCNFTASTSSATCAPTLNPTVKDVNNTTLALTGDENKLIKYYSTAAVAFGAAERNSATLSSKSCSNSGKSRTTDGNFTNITSGSFAFTAKDSRGYSTSKTINKTLIDYVKLTCSYKSRCTVDGVATVDISGNYFNGSFGAVANTLSVQYRYKAEGGSFGSWTDATISKSGNKYTAAATVSGLDYQTVYVFEVKAADKLATITPSAQTVKALPVFDWGENDFNFNVPINLPPSKYFSSGTCGINFNNSDIYKVNSIYYSDACNTAAEGLIFPRTDGNMDSFRLYDGNIYISNNCSGTYGGADWNNGTNYKVDYPIERGTSGDWHYIKWKSGWCDCWKKQRVDDVVCATAWGNGFVSPNINLGSYPFAFSERPIQNVSIHQTSAGSYLIRYPYSDSYSNTATTCGSIALFRPSSYSTKNRVYFSVRASGYLA